MAGVQTEVVDSAPRTRRHRRWAGSPLPGFTLSGFTLPGFTLPGFLPGDTRTHRAGRAVLAAAVVLTGLVVVAVLADAADAGTRLVLTLFVAVAVVAAGFLRVVVVQLQVGLATTPADREVGADPRRATMGAAWWCVIAAATGWSVSQLSAERIPTWAVVIGMAAAAVMLSLRIGPRQAAGLSAVTLVVLCAPLLVASVHGNDEAASAAEVAASRLPLTLLLAAVPVVLTGYLRWWWRTVRDLQSAGERARRAAAADERRRMSRDLHDLQGRTLQVIGWEAELAERLLTTSPERCARHLRRLREVATEAMAQNRQVVQGAGDPCLTTEHRALAELLRGSGVQVEDRCDPATVPDGLDGVLAAALREAGTNVMRHARPSRVRLEYGTDDGHGVLRVSNDGVLAPGGADCGAGSGSGLTSLHHRVDAAGGSLTAGPDGDDGWQVSVRVPAPTDEPAR